MTVKFCVLGEVRSKQRPRATVINGHARVYTPKDTVMYENLVRYAYQEQVGKKLEGAIEMHCKFFFPIPKSVSKKQRALMETETVPHTKKPDTDNCVKSVTDGTQGVAFDDDKQIYKIVAEKYYSNNPRAEIELREINEKKT